jgi:succinate dehydrogenase / fumarate reductase, cytochrome b subunit
MSWTKRLFSSSIGMKFAMALSALFLIIFLLQHFTINFLSVIAPGRFNSVSHFMGYNPVVQFALQPILLVGVVFHFVMGFVLEIKNHRARDVKYAMLKGEHAPWVSRNMIYTGLVVLAFMGLHFYDFWIHEITYKYVAGLTPEAERYYPELVAKFQSGWRVAIYCVSFVFLALHLLHGFQSAFQSIGASHEKYSPAIKALGKIYAVGIPLGFIVIALYHLIYN